MDGLRSRELFGEDSSLALVTCAQEDVARVKEIVDEYGFVFPLELGLTVHAESVDHDPDFTIFFAGEPAALETTVADLRAAFSQTLESQLAAEVVTA